MTKYKRSEYGVQRLGLPGLKRSCKAFRDDVRMTHAGLNNKCISGFFSFYIFENILTGNFELDAEKNIRIQGNIGANEAR